MNIKHCVILDKIIGKIYYTCICNTKYAEVKYDMAFCISPLLRQCFAIFAVAERWLLLDI